MKKIAVLIGLIVVLAVAVSPVSAIVGGELDTEHTNVGAIVMVWPQFDDIVGRLCSATLIHPQALVTAAHCTTYIENQGVGYDQVWVTFDQDAIYGDPQYLNIENIIVHPDFDYVTPNDSHDIALVILEEPVTGILPAPLPGIEYMDGVIQNLKGKDWRALDMIIVGYGATQPLDGGENQLDAIRRVGSVTFKDLTAFEIKTNQNASLGNDSNCAGDSGGPLYHVDKYGDETLVGLLSLCGWACNGGAIHYRLDTAEAQDFIFANLP